MIRTYRRSHAFVLCAALKCDAEINFQKLITQFIEHPNQSVFIEMISHYDNDVNDVMTSLLSNVFFFNLLQEAGAEQILFGSVSGELSRLRSISLSANDFQCFHSKDEGYAFVGRNYLRAMSSVAIYDDPCAETSPQGANWPPNRDQQALFHQVNISLNIFHSKYSSNTVPHDQGKTTSSYLCSSSSIGRALARVVPEPVVSSSSLIVGAFLSAGDDSPTDPLFSMLFDKSDAF